MEEWKRTAERRNRGDTAGEGGAVPMVCYWLVQRAGSCALVRQPSYSTLPRPHHPHTRPQSWLALCTLATPPAPGTVHNSGSQ